MATYTYTGDPSASTVEEIRYKIGDTGADGDWFLSDEEINYTYSKNPGVLSASMACVNAILAKVARYREEVTGDVVVKWQHVYANYTKLKGELYRESCLESTGIFAGGITVSGKAEVDNDTDRVDPMFTRTFGRTVDTDSGEGLFSNHYG